MDQRSYFAMPPAPPQPNSRCAHCGRPLRQPHQGWCPTQDQGCQPLTRPLWLDTGSQRVRDGALWLLVMGVIMLALALWGGWRLIQWGWG